ncbi:DEAD-box ATP-dependent RNA helicase rde-12 [Anopheles nili]|uniref:DEAD-box ATP-dependent RNA helicase rde-12 n=1 Tax=Anopheles nili TaxID=185578 RepID=UPI00237A5696|nr:DEAD-box ATP-dependent RNA helicase rde-12 [Anopheles nili]
MLKSVSVLLLAWHLVGANLVPESTVTSEKLVNAPPMHPSTTSLGSLYRSARDDYNSRRHCSNCGPGYERDMRSYGRQTGITGYYSGMGSIDDDRNWYYRPEGYDDRYRGGVSQMGNFRQPSYAGYEYDRYMHRPDDRGGYGYPAVMSMRAGYYDGPGNSRMPSYYPEMMRGFGYRGNGYDNLDPRYDYYMTQRGNPAAMSNRDRYYGSSGYYDDRMSYGGQYDNKNFRPWDQTYRGISGFDNSGRGYYFASRPSTSSSQTLPPSSSSSSSSPSSSLSAHASYHVQAHPVLTSGYNGQGSGHEHHQTGGSNAGGYRPEANHQHHYNGQDRPDYEPSDSTQNCCRNRYPEYASHGHGSSNSVHSYGGSSGGGGGAENAPRPSAAPGSWNYISGGTQTGTGGSGHAGVASSSYGSYGEPHSGPGHYPGHKNNGVTGYKHEDNKNRDDHYRDSDHRQQSAAFGGRPRPSSLGDTSYLMDRVNSVNNRDLSDQPTAAEVGATSVKPHETFTVASESNNIEQVEQHVESDKRTNQDQAA